MQFGGAGLASVGLGSILQDPGDIVDPTSLRPMLFERNGTDVGEFIAADSLTITDTLGQPVTASFVMVSPVSPPVVGDKIRIFYHSQQIFGGTIDHVTKSSPDLVTNFYQVDCLDWSQTLIRRKLRRNFINAPIQAILDSLFDNELSSETLTIGTIESRATIPLVDSRNAKVFDVCRDMAGSTGQTFYLDFDQSIQMRSVSVPAAPLTLDQDNVLLAGTSSVTDRDTYRNVQTVVVKGTPVANETVLESTQQRTNADQIAARAAIEGGSGIYEEVEEITHPTSNDAAELALLGIGYARLRLATSGTPRVTVRVQARGYGFRGGQIATVNLPTFGLVGTYVVQRVSVRVAAKTHLFHELELTSSSLQQRAYESWLAIVKGGKVTVQMPRASTNNLATFNTPGTTTWTVPAGITTVEVECVGGSGGGGGGCRFTGLDSVENGTTGAFYSDGTADGPNGGTGGNSGKAITILTVNAGDILTIIVGAAGTVGANDSRAQVKSGPVGSIQTATPGDGTDGAASSIEHRSLIVCQGNGGGKGLRSFCAIQKIDFTVYRLTKTNGLAGSTGSGIGDAVSVGGGKSGGAGGTGNPYAGGANGSDGLVEVRW